MVRRIPSEWLRPCTLQSENDNVVTIVINNSLYGMTGGQCAPTSLPGQITTSTPRGKDPKKAGMPFRVEQAFTGFDIAYLARGSMADRQDDAIQEIHQKSF